MIEKDRYTAQDVKDWLRAYMDSERDIDIQIERLDCLIAKKYSVGSPVISDMPKASTIAKDRFGKLMEIEEELEKSIREAVEEHSREKDRIESVLAHVRADEKAAIRMRYIDGMKWHDVRDALFGSKPDFFGKEDTYLRRTQRLHESALIEMADRLNKMTFKD